jgi:hypothetical protein
VSEKPFVVMDAILRACPRGLPARLLCDVMIEQGFVENLAQSVIRKTLDLGDIELASNMNLVRSERGMRRRAGVKEHLPPGIEEILPRNLHDA